VAGNRTPGEVISVSTATFHALIAEYGPIAWTIMLFYNGLLDAAIKQVNLAKMLRDFRASGLKQEDIASAEASVKAMIDSSVQSSLEKAFKEVVQHDSLPEGRYNELRIEITKISTTIVSDIKAGAKVRVRSHTEQQYRLLQQSTSAGEDRSRGDVRQLIEHQEQQEFVLDNLRRATEALPEPVRRIEDGSPVQGSPQP
jgi:hypothetical protein